MTQARTYPALLILTVLGLFPADAQTPLFNDGTALGGSQVFSEGFNPLGNCARFDQPQPQPIYGFTYIDGDQRMTDNASAMELLNGPAPSTSDISQAIRQLAGSPWGLRTRAYGIAFLADTVNGSYTHEEFNSLLATADKDAAHLDSAPFLLLNGTSADMRRTSVDRISTGAGSKNQGVALGASLRIEQWKMGTLTEAINPSGSQGPLVTTADPFQFRDTPLRTTTVSVDLGFTYDLVEGVRLGGTLNRVNAKRLWDVDEKPQGRVGLQIDIGTLAKLSLETDLNETMRMPFPVKQRTSAASLKIAASRSITLLLGGERKKLGDASVTRGGATLQINLPGFRFALGMQYSKDHPLKGFTAVFN